MAVQIGAKPDAGFENPIGMMRDCHRRVEQFLNVLHRVARKAHGRPLTAEESQAVDQALHYFRTASPRHSRDEEESLFPRLKAMAPVQPRAQQLLAQIDTLEADHRHASNLHAECDELYIRWQQAGQLAVSEQAQLEFATGELARIYSTHIAVEEGLIFPHAAELFPAEVIVEMGAEFRQRRAL